MSTKFKLWLESFTQKQAFLNKIIHNPRDLTNWMAFHDYLEENNDSCSDIIKIFLNKKIPSDDIWVSCDFKRELGYTFPIARCAFEWEISLADTKIIFRIIKNGNPNDIRRIDTLMKGFGVEPINGYNGIVALYVNMGDTYDLTVIYDMIIGKYIISDFGEFVERNQSRYGIV